MDRNIPFPVFDSNGRWIANDMNQLLTSQAHMIDSTSYIGNTANVIFNLQRRCKWNEDKVSDFETKYTGNVFPNNN